MASVSPQSTVSPSTPFSRKQRQNYNAVLGQRCKIHTHNRWNKENGGFWFNYKHSLHQTQQRGKIKWNQTKSFDTSFTRVQFTRCSVNINLSINVTLHKHNAGVYHMTSQICNSTLVKLLYSYKNSMNKNIKVRLLTPEFPCLFFGD